MTPSIPARSRIGFKTMVSRSSHSKHSLPDLNPIEHLWYHLKRRSLEGYERSPSGMIELWERVEENGTRLDAVVCQNLIESMPRRVNAVLKANGAILNTKYKQFVVRNGSKKTLPMISPY